MSTTKTESETETDATRINLAPANLGRPFEHCHPPQAETHPRFHRKEQKTGPMNKTPEKKDQFIPSFQMTSGTRVGRTSITLPPAFSRCQTSL